MAKSRPTMRDVSREAGLSLGTVSQALSNKPGVSEETRARVLEVASELGYEHRPRNTGNNVDDQKTVGVLVKQDSDGPLAINPFYSYILAAAERECRRLGLSMMYASMEVDDHNRPLADLPAMIFDQRVNGILVVGAFLKDTIVQINEQSDQVVLLVDAYAPGQNVDSIVTDNLGGATLAITHLIENGHTRIGCVGSLPDGYPSIRERRKGFTRTLKSYGLDTTAIVDSMLTREGGYNGTTALLHEHPDVTAIFACNDNVALGVMDAAFDMGLRVPDDLSIIGFDNIHLAETTKPPLTTVYVDKTLMGTLAVRNLVDLIENPDRTRLTTTLHTRLVIRETVRSLTD